MDCAERAKLGAKHYVHTHTHTHTMVIADVAGEMLPCLFFNRALMKCGDMTACDKIPPSFTPTCRAFCAARNTHSDTHWHTRRHTRSVNKRQLHALTLTFPSPVDGDEEAILAHISTPAVCLDGVFLCMCVCVCVCNSPQNRPASDGSEYQCVDLTGNSPVKCFI